MRVRGKCVFLQDVLYWENLLRWTNDPIFYRILPTRTLATNSKPRCRRRKDIRVYDPSSCITFPLLPPIPALNPQNVYISAASYASVLAYGFAFCLIFLYVFFLYS